MGFEVVYVINCVLMYHVPVSVSNVKCDVSVTSSTFSEKFAITATLQCYATMLETMWWNY